MRLGPYLVLRGAFFGTLAIVLLCSMVAANFRLGSADAGAPSPAEQAAGEASDCAVSDYFSQDILQWCDIITKYADINDLPPDLIAAVMLMESGGNPLAYSRSGAVGLLQVMPRDGIAASFQCANGPCFASRPTIAELQDPDFNIEYGTRMLAGLFARKGSLRDALYAYGPMDVGYTYADRILSIFEHAGD